VTIEESVFTVLAGDAGVTAIVPASRIKPDRVYQGLERPYIRHFAVSVDPIQTHTGMAALKMWQYQVDLFADSIESLTALRTAVMAALDAPADPKFFLRRLVRLGGVDSTDTPVIGQGLLLDVWYE